MGNYATQTRLMPGLTHQRQLYDPYGKPTTNKLDDERMLPQTTYSYRSNQPAEAIVTKADLLLGNRPYSSRYDNGHNFHTTKFTLTCERAKHYRELRGGRGAVFGHVIPLQLWNDVGYFANNSQIPSFDSTLWGNRAIADTSPSASSGDLAVFLGEFLRDGLPSFIGSTLTLPGLSKRQLSRKAGGEYLNLQFGWVPLIKDIEKALNIVKNSHAILEQYKRDDGRHVRRARSYTPVVTSSSPFMPSTVLAKINYDPAAVLTSATSSVTTTQRIKFSGAYTYHIPVGNDLLGKSARYAALADKLLGIKLTPDRLWNLMPWSWLTDWWLEIGPALEARSALSTNGQFLQYGYLQRRTDVVKTYTYSFRIRENEAPIKRIAILRETRKERIRANPLGFGFSDEAITPAQMAILAAVGISLGDGKLRKMGY